MKYEIILFDVDDTLFDFNISEENALSKAFQEFELPKGLADYYSSYKEISKELWRELEQGMMTLPELGVVRFNRLFLEHKLDIKAEKFNSMYLKYLGKEVHPIKGSEELCHQLSGYRLAVITNGYKDVQKARIASSSLCNTFELLITSEEAGAQKPSQEIFDFAFSRLQIMDKSKVLIVGDSLTSDIQGGINYGIDTCWFNRHRKKNDSGIQPTYEISELTELIKVLNS